MDFIGSKVKLNEWIFSFIEAVAPPNKDCIFLDGCSGSGVVSRYAASKGYNVVSNDIMQFPKVLTNGSIGLNSIQITRVQKWIEKLKELGGIEKFFYKEFTRPRKYFTESNARLIDEIRFLIDLEQDEKVKDCLLYCGIEALSRVSNTAGTHGAYLKEIKIRAKDKFELKLKLEDLINGTIDARCGDILQLVGTVNENILYIDPPYNTRQYPNNYHLYETFVRYDNPTLKGKTGLREKWQEEGGSKFCSNKTCLQFLKDIINKTVAKHVFISYSSDGLLKWNSEDQNGNNTIKKAFPNATMTPREQRRYKADKSKDREYDDTELIEYLIHIPRC